uniref:Uncharacterized protein n=1 Tax=Anguilla anguilla TaxID=7936 RepID=A0A0E9RV07_ANGAN
MKETRSLCA